MTEENVGDNRRYERSRFSKRVIDFGEEVSFILCIFENQSLQIEEDEPEEEGKVIASIISVPESTDHKHI